MCHLPYITGMAHTQRVLPIVDYTGRLHPKGVPFSDSRCINNYPAKLCGKLPDNLFHQNWYMRVKVWTSGGEPPNIKHFLSSSPCPLPPPPPPPPHGRAHITHWLAQFDKYWINSKLKEPPQVYSTMEKVDIEVLKVKFKLALYI